MYSAEFHFGIRSWQGAREKGLYLYKSWQPYLNRSRSPRLTASG